MDANRVKRLCLLASFGIYCFIYPSSLFLLITDSVPVGTEWMATFMLALEGLSATAWVVINFGARRGLLASGLLLLGGFAVEEIGVSSGLPFGQYYYTEALSPRLLDVPVGIMCAWLMVMLASFYTARFLVERLLPRQGWPVIVGLSALLAVLSDILMEPVAVHVQHYWVWQDGGSYYGVPWTNFAAWAVISAGLVLVMVGLTKSKNADSKANQSRYGFLPMALYHMNLFLFTTINLTHHFYLAGAIGIVLGGINGFLLWKASQTGQQPWRWLRRFRAALSATLPAED